MKLYHNYLSQFETSFYIGCTLGVLASSCIGGIAAMAVLENGTSALQVFQLAIVILLSMGFNVAVLSQQKPIIVFNLLLASVAVNTALSFVNFWMHFSH